MEPIRFPNKSNVPLVRLFWIITFALFVASGVFAQANARTNWVSGETGLLGAGARYEMMLNEKFSVGGRVGYNFLAYKLFSVSAAARFYPWGGRFYTEIDAGFGHESSIENAMDAFTGNGAVITPAVGWKIDVGQTGAFFINWIISFPFPLFMYRDWKESDTGGKFEFGPPGNAVQPFIGFGIGYAF